MSGRNCFLPNFFSQKGKHENLGTLSMCGLTKVHLECWLVLVEYSVGCGVLVSSFDIYQPPLIWAAFGLGFYLVNGDTHLLFVCIPQFIEWTVQRKNKTESIGPVLVDDGNFKAEGCPIWRWGELGLFLVYFSLIWHSKFQIPNSKFQIPNSKFQIWLR